MQAARDYVKRFYWKAYADNLTGLAGMVAYNLLLSILPLALVALFIFGQVVQSGDLQDSVLADLRRIFPGTTDETLTAALNRVQGPWTSGLSLVVALLASVWIGSSFWGALDTAFCRIYHFECRGWLRQKGFSLLMLVVVLLFMAATVAVPTLQSLLVSGARQLPFGLAEVPGLFLSLSLGLGLVLLFVILCLIYWTVPYQKVPWCTIWPGAVAATLAIGIVDYAFPFYLSNVNPIARVGTSLVFVGIVLVWFFVIAIIILGGAVVNALRFQDLDRPPPSPAAASGAEMAGV